jgi:methyl-accepting chemotaxis protein
MGQVIDLIRNVAVRTNIFVLNATIEADATAKELKHYANLI